MTLLGAFEVFKMGFAGFLCAGVWGRVFFGSDGIEDGFWRVVLATSGLGYAVTVGLHGLG